jgi:hypothetical protein
VKIKRIIIIAVLGLLEVVFISWAVASNLPHRNSEILALQKYQNDPTEENKRALLKEQEITQSEVTKRRVIGVCLGSGNLLLLVWLLRKATAPSLA